MDFNACMGISSQNYMVFCSLPFYKQDVNSNFKTITKTNFSKTKFKSSHALENPILNFVRHSSLLFNETLNILFIS